MLYQNVLLVVQAHIVYSLHITSFAVMPPGTKHKLVLNAMCKYDFVHAYADAAHVQLRLTITNRIQTSPRTLKFHK